MEIMKVAVLFSGGKDSVLALQESLRKHEVRYIVSFFSDKPEPYMYNYASMSVAIMQSLSLGLKLVTKKVEAGKEQEQISRTLESLQKDVEGIVVGVPLVKKQKDMLARAVSRAQDAVRQVQELLVLARLRTLSPSLRSWKVLDFRELLDGVRAAVADRAEEKHLRLEFETPDHPAWVEGSRDDLFDAVMNLVENALKYTEQRTQPEAGSGGVVTVVLRPAACPDPGRMDEGWEMTVSDTGIGIPQAELANLFQEFFRASNAIRRKITGTGLGLSIVEQIVRMHGGRIRVDSAENRGATFTVWLPKAP